jgi:hypothetical protein
VTVNSYDHAVLVQNIINEHRRKGDNMEFWITVSIPTIDQDTAERIAQRIASKYQGSVVQVDQEPPQGALIVGDMREDGL